MNRSVAGDFVARHLRFTSLVIVALGGAAITLVLPGHRFATIGAANAPRQIQGTGSPPSRGRQVYEANCAVCHGVNGDGNGPAAANFITRPRDFRAGLFKFHSTPTGSLPTDDDLLRTITRGLRWTGMIARPDLSESERLAAARYLKTFSPRFAAEKPLPRVKVAPRPRKTAELEAKGKILFREADCVSCHGEDGQGDGESAKDMKDDWGYPIRPGNLTWRPLKRGSELEQIYLTIATGISGTPMPAFGSIRFKHGRSSIIWNRWCRRSAGCRRRKCLAKNGRDEWRSIWAE